MTSSKRRKKTTTIRFESQNYLIQNGYNVKTLHAELWTSCAAQVGQGATTKSQQILFLLSITI